MKPVFDPKLQDEIPAWIIMHVTEVSAWMKTRGHEHWSIGGVGPVALSDAQCDRIISRLDEYAREKCSYEYGLPMFHDDAMPAMREIVRAAASSS